MSIALTTIDLAKSVFQIHCADERGNPVMRKQVTRGKLAETIHNLPKCRVVMEACAGSSHWARQFQAMGHEVQLIAPQFVVPFRKSNKNDRNDAEAIAEAAARPTMRYVPINSIEQQDIQMLHRVRSQLVKERTALGNQTRGLLAEYGIVIPQSLANLRQQLPAILADAGNELTALSREVFSELYERITELDARVALYDQRIKLGAQASPACQRLTKIPGVGPVVASAVIAAAGDGKTFKNGRQFAAWLGLVPRQAASGGKARLLGITRRGDKYLRSLLILGAQSWLIRSEGKGDPISLWINRIRREKGVQVAAVALANKLARMIWAVLAREQEFRFAS